MVRTQRTVTLQTSREGDADGGKCSVSRGSNRSLGGLAGGWVNGALEAQPGTGGAWLGLRD